MPAAAHAARHQLAAARGLAQLASAEDAQCAAFAAEVATDGVELLVATGNDLLQHRGVGRGHLVGLVEPGHRVAAKDAPPGIDLAEGDRLRRLDEEREADLLRGLGELPAFLLKQVELGGVGRRAEQLATELGQRAGDRGQTVVVGGEDRRRRGQ